MSGRRYALIAAAAMFIMFVASNLIANVWMRSWRIDLTEGQLYSLSRGTKDILHGLNEPVQLTFYFSRDVASGSPEVQAYGARVREMLHAYAAASGGKVRVVDVDVKTYTPTEDEAEQQGLQPLTLREGGDPLYFGLVGVNAIDDKIPIPAFDPEREPFLEYEITRLIYELENPEQTHVALISALPLDPGAASDPRFGPSGQSAFSSELGRLMKVQKLAPDFTEIPADTQVIALIHPPVLTPVQAFAVDQFIMRHGRAFVALDPASMVAASNSGPYGGGGAPTSSALEPLLSAWGVTMADEVVLDLDNALPTQAQDEQGRTVQAPQPMFFRIGPDQLDKKDLMTAWLRRGIYFGMAGGLDVSQREGVTSTVLARTGGQTMRIPAERALQRPSPFELLRNWLPTSARAENVAVRLSGHLPSAFPNGAPEGAPPAADGAAPLKQSAGDAEIVIVSDTDFLEDAFYIGPNGAAAADNGSFALNAIDVLGGSDALVSLRSRAASQRRMEMVERMENEARRRIEQRQEQLQTRLQETEARIADLQAGGRGSGFFSGDLGAQMTNEESAEIETFRKQASDIRTEMRDTERDLRANIDRLQAIVVFINMWLGPIVVAIAGLVLFWRRQRRGQTKKTVEKQVSGAKA